MNGSNPANKPSFQTPSRSTRREVPQSNIRKTPPTALNQNQAADTVDRSRPDLQESNDTARFRQVNIHISQRTNRPYLHSQGQILQSPSIGYNPYKPAEYMSLRPQQLLQIIELYQYQIAILKDYIHQSDLLERQRIVEIFGFDYPCFNPNTTQQSKIVLKQLSIKIKSLIHENHRLKDNIKVNYSSTPTRNQDQMLLSQNQRLRSLIQKLKTDLRNSEDMRKSAVKPKQDLSLLRQNQKLRQIIQQFKNSEDRQMSITISQLQKIKAENYELNQLIRKYKLQNDALHQSNAKMQKQPIISQIRPIRQQRSSYPNSNSNSPQQLQFAKKQITKQLFQFEQEQLNKNRLNQSKIQQLQAHLNEVSNKLKQYQRQRAMRIDSTLRKSFMLTQSILRLKGDVEPADHEHVFIFDQEAKKQQGKIKPTQGFSHKKQVEKADAQTQTDLDNDKIKRTDSQYIDGNKSKAIELKLAQEAFIMEQMKNKNILQENKMLKKKLAETEQQMQQKIQRNIKLENTIIEMQKYLAGQKNVNPQIQQELRQIIEVLKSCNVSNFDLFFQEFDQIRQQRKVLRDTVEGYKNANEAISKSKLNRNADQQKLHKNLLQQKVNELIQQNKRLLKRVDQLESQVDEYHEEIIKNQIQKLNSIKFNEPIEPSGQNAMRWQRQVKTNIESALVRLHNLQRKTKQGQKSKKSQVQSSTVVKKHLELSQISQSKYQSPKQA